MSPIAKQAVYESNDLTNAVNLGVTLVVIFSDIIHYPRKSIWIKFIVDIIKEQEFIY